MISYPETFVHDRTETIKCLLSKDLVPLPVAPQQDAKAHHKEVKTHQTDNRR